MPQLRTPVWCGGSILRKSWSHYKAEYKKKVAEKANKFNEEKENNGRETKYTYLSKYRWQF